MFSHFGLFDEQQEQGISIGTGQTDIARTNRMKLNDARWLLAGGES
jgi:hypothetical protein